MKLYLTQETFEAIPHDRRLSLGEPVYINSAPYDSTITATQAPFRSSQFNIVDGRIKNT